MKTTNERQLHVLDLLSISAKLLL